MSLFLIPVAIVAVSALAFLAVRKFGKSKVEPVAEVENEPLGYEAAPATAVEHIKPKKVETKKVSKNAPKNKSLAKIEAKPKKAVKAKK